MEKVQAMIQKFKANLQTGVTSTNERVLWALKVLDAKIDLKRIDGFENMIIDAAESLERCRECKKSGLETLDCYRTIVLWDNGTLRRQDGRCKRAQMYLANQKISKLLGGTGIGKRFANRRFETFKLTEQNRAAYSSCRAFCESFKADSTGILLYGGYGTGKTHLAAAVLAELAKKNIAGAFVVVADLLQAIRRSFGEQNQELQKIFETVKMAEVLVLDDLGAERANDWVREQLFMIINTRYENELPTIITTNKNLQELSDENVLGQRIVSRIVEMTDGVMIKSSDYRMRKLGG